MKTLTRILSFFMVLAIVWSIFNSSGLFAGFDISANAAVAVDSFHKTETISNNTSIYTDLYDVGQIVTLDCPNYSGYDESMTWISNDSSIAEVLDTYRLNFCRIECLKPGTTTVQVFEHYSVLDYWIEGPGIVHWYLVPQSRTKTYTIKVRTPQCILSYSSATSKTATLNFDAPEGASSVIMQKSTNGGATWTTATTSALDSSSTSATATGLTPTASYLFRLHVVGGKRAGDSNTVNITTAALVTGIALNKTQLNVVRGLTSTLTATVFPSNAGNKTVCWRSENEQLATVACNDDGTATITANQNGNVNITASTDEGGFSASCQVTIVNPTMVSPVASVPSGNINIGSKVSLSVQVPNATIYYTLDGSTPSRSSNKYVEPFAIMNTATLKAFAVCDSLNDSEILMVSYTAVVGVTSIVFTEPSLSLPIGNTTVMSFTLSPNNAVNKAVVYSSSDSSIFTVDANGIITGIALGDAALTIKTQDGGLIDTCAITVTPKPIYTAVDFAKIGVSPTYLLSYPYELMADIDLSANTNFMPVGNFTGVFDGGKHRISGVHGQGLFTSNSGTIMNLCVSGTIDNADGDVGGLAVYNNGLITNCTNEISVINRPDSDSAQIATGGIAGRNDGRIEYCVNKGSLITSYGVCWFQNDSFFTGGIAGISSGSIKYCCNSAEITIRSDVQNYYCMYSWAYAGGIAGDGMEIISSYNTGKVTANSFVSNCGSQTAYAEAYAGGITGIDGNLTNCYNSGDVSAVSYIYIETARIHPTYITRAYAGGISGSINADCAGTYIDPDGTDNMALYCYNTGAVSVSATGHIDSPLTSIVGTASLVGTASFATNCYCLNNVADAGGSATIKTDAQLKQQSTYAGFDFSNTWAIDPGTNSGYPYLLYSKTAVPTGLISLTQTDTTVDLLWDSAKDPTGDYGYNVYNGSTKVNSTPITSTTYTVTGLTQGTLYSFTIKAVNALGESAASAPLDVTTKIEDFTIVNHVLTKYNGTGENIAIPVGVTSIGNGAFANKTSVKDVTIPSGVTSIGNSAFYNCTNLKSINIPTGVSSIGLSAFSGCICLINVYIPNSVTFIGQNAFKNCTNLKIYCTSGSFAETYAINNSLSYTTLDINAIGTAAIVDRQHCLIYGLSGAIPSLSNRIEPLGGATMEVIKSGGSVCSTGSTVNVIFNGDIIKTYKVVIFGDINGDGNIDSVDAGVLVDHENYVTSWDPVTDAALYKASDINGDGYVDSIDAGVVVDVENYIMHIDQTTGLADVN